MLVINLIYLVSIFLTIMSIILLIYSIRNKNKNICNSICIIDIVYIIYFFIAMFLTERLFLDVGLEMLLFYLCFLVSTIIYLVSIVICCIKKRKLTKVNKSKRISILIIILLLLPVIAFFITFYREIYLLNNSNLVLVSHSNGNGSIGAASSSIHVLGTDYYEEVSIGADSGGYKIKNFLPQSYTVLKAYEYGIRYNNSTYTLDTINYLSKKDPKLNEINKEELTNIILDLKNNYNEICEADIIYLKTSNYYLIELRQLESVLIYYGEKCIHKIDGPRSFCLERAYLFE